MIRVIMFDFDGTLVDSMERLTEIAADEITKEYDIPRDKAVSFYRQSSGLPFSEQMELLFPGGEKNGVVVDRFESRKRDELFTYPLYKDTISTVETLRAREYKVVVSSSNFQENVEDYFRKHGVEFDLILGFRNGFGKGRPHFEYTMARFGVKDDELVFVGDSLKDAERALSCGIKFIGKLGMFSAELFKERFRVPVVESLSELLKIY